MLHGAKLEQAQANKAASAGYGAARRRTTALATAALFGLGWLASCGRAQDDTPQAGSNSNWLRQCADGSSCGPGLECWCGVCTQRCTSDPECPGSLACLEPAAACTSALGPACGLSCSHTSDCSSQGGDARCWEGQCVIPAPGSEGDALRAGDLDTAEGAGGMDAQGAPSMPSMLEGPSLTEPLREALECPLGGSGDGVIVRIQTPDNTWSSGQYALTLLSAGRTYRCAFTLEDSAPPDAGVAGEDGFRLVPCDPRLTMSRSPLLVCSAGICQQPFPTASYLEFALLLPFSSDLDGPPPPELSIALAREGATLLDETRTLEFSENAPDGPDCPKGWVADATFTLPE